MRQIDIEGFENYQITDDGRVWSKKKQMYLSTNRKDGQGYPQVMLYKNGVGVPVDIHRLVAKAFIPNPQNKPCIDHINTDKTLNVVSNLRWVTHTENMNNPITNQKMKTMNVGRHPSEEARNKMSLNNGKYWLGKHLSEETKQKLSESLKGRVAHNRKTVYQYTLDNKLVKVYDSVKDTVKNGFTSGSVVMCCLGKRKTHKGFRWSYKPL